MTEVPTPRERRLAAELELARAVQATTIHELGNPLQSLLVLVELSRDELREQQLGGRTVERLDHALESIARLRSVLLRATAVRAALADPDRVPDWGRLLDELAAFVDVRLQQLRSRLARDTAAIDALVLPPRRAAVRPAVLALLLGITQQLREARGRDWTVHLVGQPFVTPGGSLGGVELRVAIDGPTGAVAIADSVADAVDDLLAQAQPGGVELVREGGRLRLRCP